MKNASLRMNVRSGLKLDLSADTPPEGLETWRLGLRNLYDTENCSPD
jgi:hypothetical protein